MMILSFCRIAWVCAGAVTVSRSRRPN
jgi:hypothetical protein